MKKITILLFAAMTALTVSPAMGQGMMKKDPMMGQKMKMSNMDMMKGLTASEKKTATAMMKKMTAKEKASMMKSTEMCMMDGKMGKPMMSDDKMMMSMSKMDKMNMMSAMKKMTAAEKAVTKKIMMNCHKMGMMKKGGM